MLSATEASPAGVQGHHHPVHSPGTTGLDPRSARNSEHMASCHPGGKSQEESASSAGRCSVSEQGQIPAGDGAQETSARPRPSLSAHHGKLGILGASHSLLPPHLLPYLQDHAWADRHLPLCSLHHPPGSSPTPQLSTTLLGIQGHFRANSPRQAPHFSPPQSWKMSTTLFPLSPRSWELSDAGTSYPVP